MRRRGFLRLLAGGLGAAAAVSLSPSIPAPAAPPVPSPVDFPPEVADCVGGVLDATADLVEDVMRDGPDAALRLIPAMQELREDFGQRVVRWVLALPPEHHADAVAYLRHHADVWLTVGERPGLLAA